MKKIRNILVMITLLISGLFIIDNSKADNLELSTNGFGDIGKNEVQIVKKLNFLIKSNYLL